MTIEYDQLTVHNFGELARFIEDYSGIRMPPDKQTMVEGRLRRRVRALGLTSLHQYCHFLFEEDGLDDEAIHLIDAVSTNKTDFFREPDHFRFLAETVLPALAAAGAGSERPFKIWSAPCSTGAEPYTMAMVIDDWAQNRRGFRFDILGTDISTKVLEATLRGIYPEDMIEPVPPHFRRRYFLRARDAARQEVRVIPELRRRVSCGRLNLMDEKYPVGDMDVIFCRNVLIYFDKPTQRKVLTRLSSHLPEGGYLFVGHAETLAGFDLPLRQVASAVFLRV